MPAQDLRFAGRMFRKQPGFAFVAMVTLAVGIDAGVRHPDGARRRRRVGAADDLCDGVGVALVGIVARTVATAAVAPAIRALLFGVAPLDPATFAAVAVLLLGVAAVATYLPARRAIRIDPLTALRAE